MSVSEVTTLRLASCMAPSADPMVRALARWLSARLGMQVDLVDRVPMREMMRVARWSLTPSVSPRP